MEIPLSLKIDCGDNRPWLTLIYQFRGNEGDKMEVYMDGVKIDLFQYCNKPFLDSFKQFGNEMFRNGGYLILDWDGMVSDKSRETPSNPNPQVNYFTKRPKQVRIFRELYRAFQSKNINLAFCTGRGSLYIKNKGIGPLVGDDGEVVLICENGASISRRVNSTYKSLISPLSKVTPEAMDGFINARQYIVEAINHFGGIIESGKEVMISTNPPKSIANTNLYRNQLQEFIAQRYSMDLIGISHSSSAVDFFPPGVDKIDGVYSTVAPQKFIYGGDWDNDSKIMSSNMDSMNFTVANAHPDILKIVQNSKFGIISDKEYLVGTNEALRFIYDILFE